jgi:hypothetical protein
VYTWFERIDDLFSTWRDDTEICRLARGELALHDASDEVRTVLNLCEEIRRDTAGAFDIRTFIATLMGIFGVILVLVGIFGGNTTTSGTIVTGNPNLWVGISLLGFAAAMQGWAMLRPTVVDEAELARQKAEQDGPPAH